jgi:hypothetical protein
MTPKEKAEEIYTKFVRMESHCDDAQECALIAVDEILNNFGNLTDGKQHYCAYATIQYYKEVKQEIERL